MVICSVPSVLSQPQDAGVTIRALTHLQIVCDFGDVRDLLTF